MLVNFIDTLKHQFLQSDRGAFFGDCIPYTDSELIKMYYGWRGAKVFIPEWFIDVFQHNPYVDGTTI